jgi:hypothetical protein
MSIQPDRAKDIAAILQDDTLIDRALHRAALQAIREHKQEGLPLAMWRDGKVVWVPAEELEAELEDLADVR